MRPNMSKYHINTPLIYCSIAILFMNWGARGAPPEAIVQSDHLNKSNHETIPTRDVTDLKLTSDFRAIKLNWSYKYSTEANEPLSFEIRFCEVTSWNIEIKCRHKEIKVANKTSLEQAIPDITRRGNDDHDDKSKSVLQTKTLATTKRPLDIVANLLRSDSNPLNQNTILNYYEAQVFDLRALTNYTFQVKVAHFANEAAIETDLKNNTNNRANAARQIDLFEVGNVSRDQSQVVAAGGGRIETKPFAAEATKCLVDVTEVVITTGKYFGGRIGAEDSLDPRCSLVGNKTSDQSNYLLRIDHEVCKSKIMDGNRIETMVLVHENKDILTHNSARFLVLCNFHQKSYTLRASVSLPKVNGNAARPAIITSLPGKPPADSMGNLNTNNSQVLKDNIQTQPGDNRTQLNQVISNNSNNNQPKSVMLGSMPGIYRARSQLAGSSTETDDFGQTLSKQLPFVENPSFKRTSSLLANNSIVAYGGSSDPADNIIERGGFASSGKLLLLRTVDGVEIQPISSTSIRKAKEFNLEHSRAGVRARQRNFNFFDVVNSNHGGLGNSSTRARPMSMPLSSADASSLTTNKSTSKVARQQQQQQVSLPKPVQIQSKVLYVDRSSLFSRAGSRHQERDGLTLAAKPSPWDQQQQQRQQQQTPLNMVSLFTQKASSPAQKPTFNSRSPQTPPRDDDATSPSIQIDRMATTPQPQLPPTLNELMQAATRWPNKPPSTTTSLENSFEGGDIVKQSPTTTTTTTMTTHLDYDSSLDARSEPIIMTNNHRIAGDFLSLSSPSSSGERSANFSASQTNQSPVNSLTDLLIKYSTAQVDDYPVGREFVLTPAGSKEVVGSEENYNQTLSPASSLRARNGRMRDIDTEQGAAAAGSVSQVEARQLVHSFIRTTTTTPTPTSQANNHGDNNVVNRIGESLLRSASSPHSNATSSTYSDLIADSSDTREQQQLAHDEMVPIIASHNAPTDDSQPPASLTQNITGYLLRWSLKTLANIAKKSLESLIIKPYNSSNAGMPFNSSTEIDDYELSANIKANNDRQQFEHQQQQQSTRAAIQKQQTLEHPQQHFSLEPFTGSQIINQNESSATSGDHPTANKVIRRPTISTNINTTAAPISNRRKDELAASADVAEKRSNASELVHDISEAPSLLSSSSLLSTSTKPPRPSNYSKSLDFNRSNIEAAANPLSSGKNVIRNSNNINNNNKLKLNPLNLGINQKAIDQQQQQQHQFTTTQHRSSSLLGKVADNSAQTASSLGLDFGDDKLALSSTLSSTATAINRKTNILSSSWLLYGLLLFMSLITGIFLVFWFASLHTLMTNNINNNNNNNNENRFRLNRRDHPDGSGGRATTTTISQITGNREDRNIAGKIIQRTLQPIVQFHNQLKPNNNNNINNSINVVGENNKTISDTNVIVISAENRRAGAAVNAIGSTAPSTATLSRNHHHFPLKTTNYDDSCSYQKYDYAGACKYLDNGKDHHRFMGDDYHIDGGGATRSLLTNQAEYHTGVANSRRVRSVSPRSAASSPSTGNGSQSTRSTSANSTSTSMVSSRADSDNNVENDCKNNEFLYTEHVLINTSTAFGESFA